MGNSAIEHFVELQNLEQPPTFFKQKKKKIAAADLNTCFYLKLRITNINLNIIHLLNVAYVCKYDDVYRIAEP